MVDIILAFDEQDATMGSFNRGCLEYYEEYFSNNDIPVIYIKSAQLNVANIELKASNLKSFVFVAYSHGEPNGELNGVEGVYLSTEVNHQYFKNSFVYTVSCHVGATLGERLIKSGCLCFLGYKSHFHFWIGYKCFTDCANFGLFLFLNNYETEIIYEQMIEKYNQEIDVVYKVDFLIASLLMDNRDALICIGNNITINNLLH